jgi:hypothetical protein
MVFQKDNFTGGYGDTNVENEESQISRINSAGIINITLENLWRESYSAMARGNYLLWNSKLDAVWAILGGDCKDGDDNDKIFARINLKLYEYGNLKSKIGEGFSKKINPNSSSQYQWLLKKALFLRRLQNQQGKGTAYDRGDENDWE